MNTFIGYDVGTVEKSTGHSYIFFIADEVIGIPPLFIPFWPCREQGLFLYMVQQLILARVQNKTCLHVFSEGCARKERRLISKIAAKQRVSPIGRFCA